MIKASVICVEDLGEGLEAVLGNALHVALQDVVEVRPGRLERGLHLRQDQLGLALKRRIGCDLPGLRVKRRHARDEHHVPRPGDP